MKAKKIITIIFTVLAVGMTVMSGVMKFIAPPDMAEKIAAVGMGGWLPILGSMELAFAALFLIPKTMKLGFILLSCYFAGAIATDLSHGTPVYGAVMVIVLVWIAAFLRDRSIFLPVSTATAH